MPLCAGTTKSNVPVRNIHYVMKVVQILNAKHAYLIVSPRQVVGGDVNYLGDAYTAMHGNSHITGGRFIRGAYIYMVCPLASLFVLHDYIASVACIFQISGPPRASELLWARAQVVRSNRLRQMSY